MTYLAFTLWYADGSLMRGTTDADWLAAPSTGVQAVAVYMQDDAQSPGTYPSWLCQYGEQGFIGKRRVRERYRDFIHSFDSYWLSVSLGLWGGTNRVREIPDALAGTAAVKSGSLMNDAEWRALYGAAYETRTRDGNEEPWVPTDEERTRWGE